MDIYAPESGFVGISFVYRSYIVGCLKKKVPSNYESGSKYLPTVPSFGQAVNGLRLAARI